MIVAIDGPAGAGKSTVARCIAERLAWRYLDTGAMYRALTLKALRTGTNLTDDRELAALCVRTSLGLTHDGAGVVLDGANVSEEIRDPHVTQHVRYVAASQPVRTWMRELQRSFARAGNLVAEGRDMGTVVFPNADKKFYLDASAKERAQRRWRQLKTQNPNISIDRVLQDIVERDRSDKTRNVAPLRKAPDAVYIDTTALSVGEVILTVLREIRQAQKARTGPAQQ